MIHRMSPVSMILIMSLGLVGLLSPVFSVVDAQTSSAREIKLKAAFIFNIAKFVEWPSASFTTDGAPLAICIFGDDPFGEIFDEAFTDRNIKGRPILIMRPKTLPDSNKCHLFFISLSEKDKVSELLVTLHSNQILTVSEIEGFAESGGIVGLYTEENNLKFAINQAAAESANLNISSKLLRIGRIVN